MPSGAVSWLNIWPISYGLYVVIIIIASSILNIYPVCTASFVDMLCELHNEQSF